MASMPQHLALFDCDGTLVDSQAHICLAMEQAFAEFALPAPARHDIRRIVGLSVVQAAARLLPDAEEALLADFAQAYKQNYFDLRASGRLEEPLYDGIADLVRDLHKAGWLLGVATGKSARGLTRCLEANGLAEYFITLQTADHHPSKPDPAMITQALYEAGVSADHAVMIGDTSFDMLMAAAGGIYAIGVDWGYHEAHELTASGAAVIARDCAGLKNYLEAWRHG